MSNKLLRLFIRLAILSAVTVSCVESVEFDTGYKMPIVAHCILTESNIQELDIRLATSYGKNNESLPDGITAELQDVTGKKICSFNREGETRWIAEMTPSYGKEYVLSVKVYGEEIIRAKTVFPLDVYVKQFMKRRSGPIMEYLYYSCELRIPFIDSEGIEHTEGAAYDASANMWISPKEGSLIGTTHPYADDFNLATTTVADLPCFSSDSMKLWNMGVNEVRRWMKEKYQGLRLHDGIVRVLSPEMFDNGENPATISDNPLYTTRSFILFADFPIKNSPPDGNLFNFYFVSKELDLYLKDIYQKEINRGRDMRMIYNKENIYTSLSSGMGVFGAIIYRAEEQALRGYNGDFFPDEE
ncbi:MAG: DUF4249 family protein [Bacteroidales bacterium]|nr:DUF4249 family protein [Bacteroidales bacterium]